MTQHYFNRRRVNLTIYFSDSPSTVDVEAVMHMNTEGGLLRIITEDGKSQWWPLSSVFNIRETDRWTV